mmetsp:Transcript_27645/g.50185  ORF Transcript_27645/g.50185 Transcript_27645/m.50185 type:complete len:210 (-) Transcript_27645:1653-2282(-)
MRDFVSLSISMTLLLESRLASVSTILKILKSSSIFALVALPLTKSFVIILVPSVVTLSSTPSGRTGVVMTLTLTPPVYVPILRERATSEYSPAPVSIIIRLKSERSGASSSERPETSTARLTYPIPDVEPISWRITVTEESFSFSVTAIGYSVTSFVRSLSVRLGMVALASGESSAACNVFSSLVWLMIFSSSSSLRDDLICARRSFSS